MRQQFVCVRITGMNGVNLRRFEFDYDVTWNAFFLDANLNVYSRYGGRDEREPEDRLSKESLLHTMRQVLDIHSRREELAREGVDYLQPIAAGRTIPEDIPLLRRNHQGCVHCHQVREYQLLQWSHDGEFGRDRLFRWPLPETLGIEIDFSHGHRVEAVKDASPAQAAGLLPRDVIEQVNGVPIRSEYDIRWALDRAPAAAPLALVVSRPGQEQHDGSIRVEIQPTGAWKQTDLSWRKSMRSVPLPFGFRGYALTPSQRKTEGFSAGQLAIKVISVQPRSLAENLGLQKGDILVALECNDADRDLDEFKSDLLRLYRPGDRVRVTVRRGGKLADLTGPFPNWSTDETTVP